MLFVALEDKKYSLSSSDSRKLLLRPGLMPRSTFTSTNSCDLGPKSLLCFLHPNVITRLFSLGDSLFTLLQLFLLSLDLIMGKGQLLLSLAKLQTLILDLLLKTGKCRFNTFFLSICFSQLSAKILNLFLSHNQSLDSSYTACLLVFQLSMGIIHPFFSNVGCLDCLEQSSKVNILKDNNINI